MKYYPGKFAWKIPTPSDWYWREEHSELRQYWGTGLVDGKIYELHSENDHELVDFTLRIAGDIARKGLNVAYFDINFALTPERIKRHVWEGSEEKEAAWGKFVAFCPKYYEHLPYLVQKTDSEWLKCKVIFITGYSDLLVEQIIDLEYPSDGEVDVQERGDILEANLMGMRDYIAHTRQVVVLANHISQSLGYHDREWHEEAAKRLDMHCDIRCKPRL